MARTTLESRELRLLVLRALNAELHSDGRLDDVLLEVRRKGDWDLLAVQGDFKQEDLEKAIAVIMPRLRATYQVSNQ